MPSIETSGDTGMSLLPEIVSSSAALGDAGLGRRGELRPGQIDLEEFVGRYEPAARVAIEQVVAAGEPEILVRRGNHDLPSILSRGASMSAIRIVVLAILAFGAGWGA